MAALSAEDAKQLKDVVEMVASIEHMYQASEKQYKKLSGNANDALDHNNPVELGIVSKQLDKELPAAQKAMEECLRSITAALALIKQLGDNSAIMDAKGDAIEGLAKNIGGKQRTLADQIRESRELEKRIDKAKGAADTAAENQEAELDSQKSEIEDFIEHANKAFAPAESLEKQIRKAAADGDRKTMQDLRVKYFDMGFGKVQDRGRVLLARITKLKDGLKDAKQHQLAVNLESDLKGLLDDCEHLTKTHAELVRLQVAEKAPPKPAKLGASEVAKIAQLLPINAKDSKEIAKLTKLLNDNTHDDWQKAMIKVFDWSKADVEKAMKKVDQLAFVKPLYLIDI